MSSYAIERGGKDGHGQALVRITLYERETLERIRATLVDKTEAFECESVRRLILRAVEDQLEPYRRLH